MSGAFTTCDLFEVIIKKDKDIDDFKNAIKEKQPY